jgi:ABC-type sugar transport system, ATPase component
MSDNLVLEAKSVSKFFGTITALQNVDLHLNKGEVLGVVGDNGAGKSTLMKVLSGLYKPK